MKILHRKFQRKHNRHFSCLYLFLLCASLCSSFSCKQTSDIPQNIEEASKLVWIEGGAYKMGNENTPDASPLIDQKIQGFWIQKYEVTNLQFHQFVEATNYITLAEKNGGSYVFDVNGTDSTFLSAAPWWKFKKNANWRNPNGEKNITVSDNYLPVAHIAYVDACAYCEWLNMRLPTEAEWEFVARENGDVADKNIWQGNFPFENKNTDGFLYTSPVGSFAVGRKGLHDMNGNVWEWCSDYYHSNWYTLAADFPEKLRVEGPTKPYDPAMPHDTFRVIRGGSYLCSENFCTGYLPSSRMRSQVNMTFGHIGFRCVKEK